MARQQIDYYRKGHKLMVRKTTKAARQSAYAEFITEIELYVEYKLLRKILFRKIVNYYKDNMRNEQKK